MASKELQNFIRLMVKQAYDEGIKVTELNEMIKEEREKVGLCRQEPKGIVIYREATDKEMRFQKKVYKFLEKEISLEEATPDSFKESGVKLSEKTYKSDLLFFSEIIRAAKMLANDGKKITNENIRHILWNGGRCKNYNHFLYLISSSIRELQRIAREKWLNGSWKDFDTGYFTDAIMNGYFQLLEKNRIR